MPMNRLKLNDSKTKFLGFHSNIAHNPSPSIQIGEDEITTSASARNLGVIFYATLSLKPHIASIIKAAFFHLCCISRICRFLTPKLIKTLVDSLISSMLNYCNSALAGLLVINLQRLQCVKNAAAQLTVKCWKRDHITPHLMDLHWLLVCSRITYEIMVLTYHALKVPDHIKSLLTPYMPTLTLRSIDKPSLVAAHYITNTYSARALSVFDPTQYNALLLAIQLGPTLFTFKSRLKTHLFCAAYEA